MVSWVVEALVRTIVPEAKPEYRFPRRNSGDVVALVVVPKCSVGVKGYEPPPSPVASFPSQRSALPVIVTHVGIRLRPRVEEAVTTPEDDVTSTPLCADETVRLVVDAVSKYPVPDTESAVEDA